jgi:hypothetical protein
MPFWLTLDLVMIVVSLAAEKLARVENVDALQTLIFYGLVALFQCADHNPPHLAASTGVTCTGEASPLSGSGTKLRVRFPHAHGKVQFTPSQSCFLLDQTP